LVLRVDFGGRGAVGPGKIRLLEEIERTGSISAAGRELEMSYRRSWLLVDDLNRCFREPVVASQRGGTKGGGAGLTEFGRELIRRFRAVEAAAAAAAQPDMAVLADMLAPPGQG
jgi:molybdate transport system regulatory protein